MRTVTTAPDVQAVERLLMRIEADAHRGGWDQPPALYLLFDRSHRETAEHYRCLMAPRRGPAVLCGPYGAQSMVPAAVFDGSPPVALFRLALNLTHGRDVQPVAVFLAELRQPGFIGVAFLNESWTMRMTEEEHAALDPKRRYADTPGATEERNVVAIDTADVRYMVNRTRGSKPEVNHTDDEVRLKGVVIDCLRAITCAIVGVPGPELKDPPYGWTGR